MRLFIHTDGGARGNPGPAAIGVVIEEGNKTIASFGKRIGKATNNIAEYSAVIEALSYLGNRGLGTGDTIQFFLDSTLVVNQLNGRFKVREPHLRELMMKIRELEATIGGAVMYHAVPREENKRADFFVNQALDA